jgi:hypothetical protein
VSDEAGKLTLRDESRGENHRFLCAYCDDKGNLHVDGQDLGPSTAMISDDGEYEWFQTIEAVHLPRLVKALGGSEGEPILTVLARYRGEASYDFERILRESGIPVDRDTW